MVVFVDVNSEGSKEGDVRRVKGVNSLAHQLPAAAFETFVSKIGETVFPAGGGVQGPPK